MAKIQIKQIRSAIGRTKDQKRTLQALGLNKISQQREHEKNPQILGMVAKVAHLIEIKEL